jgi:hypothetical protein
MECEQMLKRQFPSEEVLAWREGYLTSLRHVIPIQSDTPQGLEEGNTKTGKRGKFFASIFVWNLPSIVTCHAATSWCKRHCYNADPRENVFPVRRWAENWWWSLNDPGALSIVISQQLKNAAAPCAVRLHSSGDFFSPEYVKFWERIVTGCPSVRFWGYTRSWAIPELKSAIENLRSLPNCQLFASWDAEMPPAPLNWRTAIVFESKQSLAQYQAGRQNQYTCPEQIGQAENCASCGECMRSSETDILFYLH